MAQYNLKNPAVKRLMKEAQELHESTDEYSAQPLDDNLFEWHFTVRGPDETDFQGGIYHGRIILPAEYPMKPPSIMILTPNGRFEINKKICLSISGIYIYIFIGLCVINNFRYRIAKRILYNNIRIYIWHV